MDCLGSVENSGIIIEIGGDPLEIHFLRQPCLLYETVELLYAYVNRISPELLTSQGLYCIPPQDVAALIAKACGDLDPFSESLQKFFTPHSYSRTPNQTTCLAFIMVYTFMNFEDLDLDRQTDWMVATWERIRRGSYHIQQISRYAMDIIEHQDGSPSSLAKELKQLPIRKDFYAALLEAFSDFPYQVSLLRALIRPVAEKLSKLLVPFVERAMPLADRWEQLFQENCVEAFLQSRGAMLVEPPLAGAWFILRYLGCRMGNGEINQKTNELLTLLGVSLNPSLAPARKETELSETEFAAFRLLGDQVRSKIIHTLQDKAMYMQELTNCLGLNPGTVSRNLNSLSNAHLLEKEIRGDRYYYRTNLDYIRTVFRHMLDYYSGQEEL